MTLFPSSMLFSTSHATHLLFAASGDRYTTVVEHWFIRSRSFCRMYSARLLSKGSRTERSLNSIGELSFFAWPLNRVTSPISSYAKLIETFLRPVSACFRISFARSSRSRVSPSERLLLPPPPPLGEQLHNLHEGLEGVP